LAAVAATGAAMALRATSVPDQAYGVHVSEKDWPVNA
jgi:hypothetical protein